MGHEKLPEFSPLNPHTTVTSMSSHSAVAGTVTAKTSSLDSIQLYLTAIKSPDSTLSFPPNSLLFPSLQTHPQHPLPRRRLPPLHRHLLSRLLPLPLPLRPLLRPLPFLVQRYHLLFPPHFTPPHSNP
ncbi:hypothetical protein CCACVL1_27153 [Corchorus capsularis]|uniref:Uncharacterized protein n=1 Tax=Corchorus capsularis TaxID=210143 RepID=A0A1R3GBZ5_COCAP|nr:hypothetical protein CCACVL1_27153 [Corchorus capsularis]